MLLCYCMMFSRSSKKIYPVDMILILYILLVFQNRLFSVTQCLADVYNWCSLLICWKGMVFTQFNMIDLGEYQDLFNAIDVRLYCSMIFLKISEKIHTEYDLDPVRYVSFLSLSWRTPTYSLNYQEILTYYMHMTAILEEEYQQ